MKRKRKDPMAIPNLTPEQRAAFADLLASKDQDMLKEMLSLVYDAAIKAQFDEHIGAEPHERSDTRRDQRTGSRTRGLNTRAGSLDLEIPRARHSNFRPTVIEHFRRSERSLISVIPRGVCCRHQYAKDGKRTRGDGRRAARKVPDQRPFRGA